MYIKVQKITSMAVYSTMLRSANCCVAITQILQISLFAVTLFSTLISNCNYMGLAYIIETLSHFSLITKFLHLAITMNSLFLNGSLLCRKFSNGKADRQNLFREHLKRIFDRKLILMNLARYGLNFPIP